VNIFCYSLISVIPDIHVLLQVLRDSVQSCVIDAEAVAWDIEKQQILPFQVLSTRKRKVNQFITNRGVTLINLRILF
jgi:ATP-dependent DNA ligase